jgi:hypothetical protein
MKQIKINPGVLCIVLAMLAMLGCSKNGSSPGPAPNPCAGITVVVNGTATSTTGPGISDGSIAASASGGSGFTFSLNGGAFQSSGTFSNLSAGAYTITAKNSAGCTGVGSFTVNTGDPCIGKNITVALASTNSDKCVATGSVTVTAAGGTGFTYRLDASGTYQSAAVFTNVSAGNHTVYVKDASGCEKTAAVTIEALPNGPLFTNVATLLRTKCANCHTNGVSNGGASYETDCGIVALRNRIKARTIDSGDMPQGGSLSVAEKKVITDWYAAGGLSSK